MRKKARRRPPRTRRIAIRSPLARRVLLAIVLLAVVVFPVSSLATVGQPQPAACRGCRTQSAIAQRWAAPLPGAWAAGGTAGTAGTVPATGQAYVAAGDGIVAVGHGLTLTAFALSDGAPRWRVTLAGPAGASITSVRAWPGVVTAGILTADGQHRTEAVIDAATGRAIHRFKAAVFGGAVAASLASTVIVGVKGVTSYDNKTGRKHWYRATGVNRSWRTDGQTLYVAESAGGYLSSSPVTALKVINLQSGDERTLSSPLGQPFSGTLAMATDGAVLFASATGVTAYSGSTGDALWSMAAAVPEGVDPEADLIYLTSSGSTLTGVDPLTGAVKASVSGSTADGGTAGIYVVRGGVALGLDSGANGAAWGYSVAAGRVTWTSAALPWPHYFSDLSGLGGSAAVASDVVVVTACPKLDAATTTCSDPELVAFTL
jgi:hypothetical protein